MNDDAFACLGDMAILLDGAGNAQGAAKCCIDFLIAQLEARPDMPLNELIGIANHFFLGANQESTLLVLQVQGSSLLSAVSCGDSPLYLVREGRVDQMNEITKPRLGTLRPGIKQLAFPLRTADVIIGASDGLCLDSYRLLSAVQRTMPQPESMPEVILQAQRDSFDDVTLVCRVIRQQTTGEVLIEEDSEVNQFSSSLQSIQVRPKLSGQHCERIVQAAAPSRPEAEAALTPAYRRS